MADARVAKLGVVIIDDHLMFAEGLARLLDREDDIEVLGIAAGGSAAVDLALRLRPHVVLVDYQLSGRDGLALTAEIKAENPETQFIMLTGSTDDRLLLTAVAAGCSGFLTKDRAAVEVAAAVRSAAAGGAPVSPSILARLFPMLGRADQSPDRNLNEPERELLVGLMQRLLR